MKSQSEDDKYLFFLAGMVQLIADVPAVGSEAQKLLPGVWIFSQ
ncbi:hypothetical protein [Pseudomonas sp. AMR01]